MFYNSAFDKRKGHNERGGAALILIIFLGVATLTVLTIMATNSMRETRNLDKSRSKLHEKWQARSGANILAQVVAKDAPAQVESDVRWARNECSLATSLPIFDTEDVRGGSYPAISFVGGEMRCGEGNSAVGFSSIFGTFNNWRDARIPLFEATGRTKFNLDANNVKIIQLDEIYRRSITDSDVAYAVRYIVEAKVGNYRTRTNGEIILGTNLPTCGTSATLEVSPATVERGNPVEMNITYSYANLLQIYNSANTLIHEERVSEQSTPQIFIYRFTPAQTETYRVVASGSSGCQARSATVLITVFDPPPVCPRIIDFSASSLLINAGDTVTLSWNVQDAAEVLFENAPVSASGSQNFVLNATRTFTLTTRDAANTCPLTRQITVEVRPIPPSCPFATPTINFSANPTSIAIGESSMLSWNITGLDASGTAVITGANGLNQSVGASGTQSVTPPATPGDYVYTLKAENICPDGTTMTSTATVVISVRACPPPNITAFTVNPSSVTAGGNQMIMFSWNIDGTADAVSISNGVGGGLPRSGFVEIPQPQTTTTYTITAVGCGQTRQAQVTVVVNACPVPVINSFTVNPQIVSAGGNQTIRFMWDVAGTSETMNISGIGNVVGNFIDVPQPQTTTDYVLTVSGCGTPVTRTVRVEVMPPGGESCNFNMNSDPICSVLNVSQCGPHKIEGSITTSGNNFSFVQTHSAFAAFGQDYLSNVSFDVRDSSNRQITQGSWSYTQAGNAYWIQQPSGAGTLSQNGVTISGTLPAGVSLPLAASFTVGYGASAGNDVRNFNSLTSPGGCGSTGGGTCTTSEDIIYYCEEHTNAQFIVSAPVTFNHIGNQTVIYVSLPQTGYFNNVYAGGNYDVYNNNGLVESKGWTSNPAYQNNPAWKYVPGGGGLELTFNSGNNFFIQGSYSITTDGSCTIIMPGNGFTFSASDTCQASLFKTPEILENQSHPLPVFASLFSLGSSCTGF